MEFKIDTDIPPPISRTNRPLTYPWSTMKPGESFIVEEKISPKRAGQIAGLGRGWCGRNQPECHILRKLDADTGFYRFWKMLKKDQV